MNKLTIHNSIIPSNDRRDEERKKKYWGRKECGQIQPPSFNNVSACEFQSLKLFSANDNKRIKMRSLAKRVLKVELPANVINNNIQRKDSLWQGTLWIKRKHTSINSNHHQFLLKKKKNRYKISQVKSNDIHLIFTMHHEWGLVRGFRGERPSSSWLAIWV